MGALLCCTRGELYTPITRPPCCLGCRRKRYRHYPAARSDERPPSPYLRK